ncbi:MAG: hypothetical protein SF066_06575 [Thermoanaerobaculia bacterium]|nr:hypothetical protein [Thermoanaerobaculia bacterium]
MAAALPAVTIASNNYLALARVWAESYREFHPGAPVFLCVVDTPSPAVDYDAFPAQVIFAHELPIPGFRNFAFRYDVLELNTAVKAALLDHLRDAFGLDRVAYFDPDILVLDQLGGLAEVLDHHPLALTPHVTGPLDDRRNPSERKIRMVGVYNLGFVALRLDDSTRGFLTWWADKLHRFCRNEPWSGLFVDQAWMDFAPAYVENVAILREPIYNVAYWNLPQREVSRRGGRWLVDDRPIGFFHFSGMDFTDLDRVSRHQDRLAPGEVPAVRPLFAEYRRRVEAAGHAELRRQPYGYERFAPDGPAVPAFARRVLARIDPEGRRFADPFERTGDDNFFDYMAQGLAFPAGVVSRGALCLWESRPDLRRRFPNPGDGDLEAFRAWLESDEPGRPELPAEWRVTPLGGEVGEWVAAVGEAANDRRGGPPWPPFFARLLTTVGHDDLRTKPPLERLAELDLGTLGPLTPWLNDPVPGTAQPRPFLTRLALLVHASRPDLEVAFPDPLGRDQRAFAQWFCRYGPAELGLHPDYVLPIADSLPRFFPRSTPPPRLHLPPLPAAAKPEPVVEAAPNFMSRGARLANSPLPGPRGVNVIGPLAEFGAAGLWARGCAELARSVGWPVAELDVGDDVWGQQVGGLGSPAAGVPFGLTLVASPADAVHKTLSRVPVPRFADGGLIGLWSWDYGWLSPDLAYWSVPFDELWVPNAALAAAVAPVVDVAVRVVRPWLGPPPEPAPRAELGFGEAPDRVVFVVPFDGTEVDGEREGLALVLAAFAGLAAARPERVGLCLSATGAFPSAARLACLETELAGLPAVVAPDPRRTPALIAAADALLTLPRAEGLGFAAALAGQAGVPVVAPMASPFDEWLDAASGFPVPARAVRLGAWRGSLPPTVAWRESDPEAISAALAQVCDFPDEARQRAAVARSRVAALHGEGAIAALNRELGRLGERFSP